jgi:hypothetical protein
MVDGGKKLHTELHLSQFLHSGFTIETAVRQFNRTRRIPGGMFADAGGLASGKHEKMPAVIERGNRVL